jgi:hypothetical protein
MVQHSLRAWQQQQQQHLVAAQAALGEHQQLQMHLSDPCPLGCHSCVTWCCRTFVRASCLPC